MNISFKEFGNKVEKEYPPKVGEILPVFFYPNTYDMDVSENKGTPKWIVYNGKPY